MKNQNKKYPLIKLFDLNDYNVLFDAKANIGIKLNNNEVETLTKYINSELDKKNLDYLKYKNIQKKGLLKEGKLKQRCKKTSVNFNKIFKRSNDIVFIKKLCVEVTQECNLRCKYCEFTTAENDKSDTISRKHTKNKISFETAKKAIDFYYQRLAHIHKSSKHSNFSEFISKLEPTITFYGGEALLEFNLIKNIIEYFHSLDFKILDIKKEDFKLLINTNLTIINNEMLDFFKSKNITLHISLDGPKEINDSKRVFPNGKGSFDIIKKNLDFIKEFDKDFYFNNTHYLIVKHNKNDIKITNDFYNNFNDNGVIPNKTYISLKKRGICFPDADKTLRDLEDSFNEQITKFKQKLASFNSELEQDKEYMQSLSLEDDPFFSEIGEVIFSHFVVNNYEHKFISYNYHNKSNICNVGYYSLYVDVNGNFHLCEKTDGTFSIGDVNSGLNKKSIKSLVNKFVSVMESENCKNCWAFYFCEICPAHIIHDKDMFSPNKVECNLMRKQIELSISKYFIILNEYPHILEKFIERFPSIQESNQMVINN